jgi:sugar lactone lactonase YvrE
MMKRLLLVSLVSLFVLLSGLHLISELNPQPWTPPSNPGLTGQYAQNKHLDTHFHKAIETSEGPEDFTFDQQGHLFTGLANGDIVKIDVSATDPQPVVLTNTGGRPLGMRFDAMGNLIIADAIKGLLRYSAGNIEVLADTYQGQALKFVDHLTIGQDGLIYFSDASSRFGMEGYKYDFLEASMTGRIFVYDPTSGQLNVLVDDLYFANGVALSADGNELYINETGKARILKYRLKGPDAGSLSVLVDALPGYPDNLYMDETGILWVGVIGLRDPLLENLAGLPFVRKLMGGLPHSALISLNAYGFVLGLELSGDEVATVKHNFQGQAHYTNVTTAIPYNGKLYLGSLYQPNITVVALP